MTTLKFTSRAHAMDRYVDAEKLAAFDACRLADVGYHDPRDSWDRLRNYEIENRLYDQSVSKGDDDVWIVTEWCPFNGIFCNYMKVASTKDLKAALRLHQEARRKDKHAVAPYVFDDLREAIALRGDQPETSYYPEGLNLFVMVHQKEEGAE